MNQESKKLSTPAQYHSLAVTMRVCVDNRVQRQLSGRVFCPCISDSAFLFTDIGNLLLQMEEIFDSRGIPAPYHRTRSFGNPRGESLASDVMLRDEITENLQKIEGHQGELYTFVVLVTTRQNATWQGRIDWAEGDQQKFISALQLIRIIDARLIG